MLIAGVLAPLASFLLIVAGATWRTVRQRGGGPDAPLPWLARLRADLLATGAIGLGAVLATVGVLIWASGSAEQRSAWMAQAAGDALTWIRIGSVPVQVGVNLDSLTLIVFLMVTLCATCIHVFSIGYMHGDSRYGRFFGYLSLFCFSMLGLVISRSLLLLFVFWELVGLCSYLLIGFWFEKLSARRAATKAFVVNRIGDFGFMIGLALCLVHLHTLDLGEASVAFAETGAAAAHVEAAVEGGTAHAPAPETHALARPGLLGLSLATWMGLLLFCGAIGKSAQFPLHVWLPDAMEGPTPVSALIHAATMVAAGVYLVARIYGLLTLDALGIIAAVGCITLTMAALMALVQTDIKRVLAYSTLSQLGYMIFGLGVGAWVGAVFHLLTHAFFKALMFLCAGQVIAACHHEQDMRKMGGLWARLPRTAITFLIGVLAIAAAGIPLSPLGIGGFYSKEEILETAWARLTPGHGVPAIAVWLFVLPIAVSLLTPLYMGRCFILTFLGTPRDEHIFRHAEEKPVMYRPLLVLAGLTVVSGWFLFRAFVAGAAPLQAPILTALAHGEGHHGGPVAWIGGLAWIVGLGAAWWLYGGGLARAEAIRRSRFVRPVHTLLVNRFYFDHLYEGVLLRASHVLAWICRLFDAWIVDGVAHTLAYLGVRAAKFSGNVVDALGVDGAFNGSAAGTARLSNLLGAVQSGRIRHYILIAMTLLAALLMYALTGARTVALLLAAGGLMILLLSRSDVPGKQSGVSSTT